MIDLALQQDIVDAASKLVESGADWVTFYREVLGLRGIIRQNFPTMELLAEFEQTEAYAEIQRLLTKLRQCEPAAEARQEVTKVITVRLPKSLHEALRAEAHEHQTSMNKLCISKLLQFIDNALVPSEIIEP
jgi:predicted HicB family RNase H-like nuclease